MAVLHDYSAGVTEQSVASHSRELSQHKEAMKTANGKLRQARKEMEAAGIDLKAYDLAMSLQKLDPTEAIGRLNKTYFILKALQAPVGQQLDFIDMVTDNSSMSLEERKKRWRGEGYNAFLTNKKEADCPHDPTQPAGQEWLGGFRDAEWSHAQAQKDLQKERPALADAPAPEAPAEKKTRGRPKGSGKKTDNVVPLKPADPAEPAADAAPPAPPSDDEEVPFDDEPPAPPSEEAATGFVH